MYCPASAWHPQPLGTAGTSWQTPGPHKGTGTAGNQVDTIRALVNTVRVQVTANMPPGERERSACRGPDRSQGTQKLADLWDPKLLLSLKEIELKPRDELSQLQGLHHHCPPLECQCTGLLVFSADGLPPAPPRGYFHHPFPQAPHRELEKLVTPVPGLSPLHQFSCLHTPLPGLPNQVLGRLSPKGAASPLHLLQTPC